ncbi:2-aminoethylphosphonate--pyruvate transaminase [Lactococcus termiticola]|uniref:2-aminoethylphosphonate--pyruvate transaminase n=1 Tax=Lactococcus termiticola TaxID=2169526 RepID=A0A2R5HDX6_9LACT|nr:2-aminoethylphosphonate--pyruvate transaminase [Lactococcus termiticola]GBG96259.1 2-aminoethylphosphonate-pyruvate aminotransferase [Lactococcus termiticola]
MKQEYKLLTPGPLTTTATVKEAMLVDHCTWDDDYKRITQDIRAKLLEIAGASGQDYTSILMQGSGSFGVESVISSVLDSEDCLLILSNGAYGQRLGEIAAAHKLNFVLYEQAYNQQPDVHEVSDLLRVHPEISHIAMVHSETTTGMLNDLEPFAELCKEKDLYFIVDAMSSFGGIEIDVTGLDIDYLISSANKCLQGVPGFSFIIAKKSSLEVSRGKADTLSLDLHAQYDGMFDGKWRFTSPTHVVIAFEQALKEFEAEGGIPARHARYAGNMGILIENFKEIGLMSYLTEDNQGPFIATFHYPRDNFDFKDMYAFIKERGYAIYPGKLNNMDTFRIGVIGEIYPEDIKLLTAVMKEYFSK